MNGPPQEGQPVSREEFLEFQRRVYRILRGLVELYLFYEPEEAFPERWLRPLKERLERTSRLLQHLQGLTEEMEGLWGGNGK